MRDFDLHIGCVSAFAAAPHELGRHSEPFTRLRLVGHIALRRGFAVRSGVCALGHRFWFGGHTASRYPTISRSVQFLRPRSRSDTNIADSLMRRATSRSDRPDSLRASLASAPVAALSGTCISFVTMKMSDGRTRRTSELTWVLVSVSVMVSVASRSAPILGLGRCGLLLRPY